MGAPRVKNPDARREETKTEPRRVPAFVPARMSAAESLEALSESSFSAESAAVVVATDDVFLVGRVTSAETFRDFSRERGENGGVDD